MTNEEAILRLQNIKDHPETYWNNCADNEAMRMAIEALKEQRPHGKWIGNRKKVFVMCSNCRTWHKFNNFCSYCGADMRGAKK